MGYRPKAFLAVRGELKQALVQQHPVVAMIDKGLGWTMIFGVVVFETYMLTTNCLRLVDGVSPADIMNVSGAFCSFVLGLLAFLLWHSFCYYDPRVRNIMKTPTKLTPNGFMRSGFVPIPAATSVGLLMFCTASFVSPGLLPGSFLTVAGAGPFLPWLPEMSCTASSIEEPDFLTRWGARFDRDGPAGLGAMFSALLNPTQTADEDMPEPEGACFRPLQEFGKDDVINSDGTDKNITNLANPQGDPTRICMYACVNWKTIDFKTVLTSLGSISVGAAIVVELTDKVSSRFGLPTVKGWTTVTDLDKLLKKTDPNHLARRLLKPFQASMVAAAFPIVVIGILLKFVLVVKIDADGYNTEDYYVTYALAYSVALVTLMRIWHPFEGRPQIYTKALWSSGVDSFVIENEVLTKWEGIYGKGSIEVVKKIGEHLTLVKIDLYLWMHLRGKERAGLLINRCRRPEREESSIKKVTTLAQAEVKVKHKLAYEGEEIESEKMVHLDQGVELTPVGWKDDDVVKCEVMIGGRKEVVDVDKHSVLEASEEWEALAKEYKFGGLEEELLA